MKNTQFKKKKLFYALSLCLLVVILSAAAVSVFAADDNTASSGWTFTEDTVANPVYVKEYFAELPRAYEAVVNFPAGNYSATSPIISNKPNSDTRNCFGFEITNEGKPKIFYYETSYVTNTLTKTKTEVVFNYSVIGKENVRLTVVNEIVDSTSVYKLYVNGVILNDATVTNTVVHDFDAEYSQSTARELSIGGDGANYFRGTLYSLAVYNNALTEAEAANTAKANMEAGSTKLMAYYDSEMSGNSDGFIKDQTGKGHDASEAFFERKNALNDYAYSFAFVGDTQFLVYKDITGKTTKYASPIYDWIVQNKDEKKIEYVLGMGDVTDKNEHAEWEYAVNLHNKLSDAEIPYAVIPGNHDGGNRFNAYFGGVSSFTDNIDGKKADSDFQNYYMNFEVGQHKYMIVALQYGAPDGVLTWANDVVSANPDRRVIVITHNLFDYEGNLNKAGQREQSTTSNTDLNNGIDMWNEFISLHENIIIAAAGHVDPENIKHRIVTGDNQNTVHTFLIDPQGLDKATQYKTGMVAMFYFSEDGSDVQVEYISTYKTLEAQKADSSADDILFNEKNQFSFTTAKVPSYDTAYGNIPEGEDNNVVLFKKDSSSATGYTFHKGYTSFGDAATAAGLIGGVGSEVDGADCVILFRKATSIANVSGVTGYSNNVIIDLGGYELTSNDPCFFTLTNTVTDSTAYGTITVKNGSFLYTGGGTASSIIRTAAKGGTYTINFEDLRISAQTTETSKQLYLVISTAGTSGAANIINSTFTNCVFDYTEAQKKCYMFGSGGGAAINATLVGCKIIAKDNTFKLIDTNNQQHGLAFYANYPTNSNDTLKYGAGNTLLLAKGTTAPTTAQQDDLKFVYSTTAAYNEIEYDAYEIAVKTDYGNIPARYAYDKIVVFKSDGTCIGGYSKFEDAATAAGLVFPKRTPDCVILFRGDYSHEDLFAIGDYTNSVIIDLGGNTVTLAESNCSFIQLTNISHTDTANPETITVRNGYFNLTTGSGGTSLVRLNGTSGTHYVNCENVTIKSTATPYVAVSTQGTSTNVVNATFTNCVFDYADNSSKCYMFGSNSTGQINATITSCKIIGSSTIPMNLILPTNSGTTHALAFYTGTPADTLAYGEGNTLLLKEGTDAPTSTDDVEFVYSETLDGYDVYELNVKEVDNTGVETDYGTIGSDYANSPFVVFYKKEGAYVFDLGYNTYKTAMERAVALTKGDGTAITNDVVVLLRTENLVDTTFPNNMSDIAGTVTLDLNGYTFTAATSMGNTATDDCGTNEKGIINVINGKLLMKSYGIIFSQISGTYDASKPVKTLEYNFKNVEIGFASDADSSALLVSDWKMEGTKSAIFNVNFENCTIDMVTNAPATSKLGIFNRTATSTCGCYNITFKGGNIIADKTSKLAFSVKASKDSVTFSPDENGKYTTVTLPTTADIISIPLNTTNVALVTSSEDGSNTVYTFAPATDVGTAYGTIPAIYTNANPYSFVVFKSDKTFVGGCSSFGNAAAAAGLTGTAGTTDYVILFRGDYTHATKLSITNYTNNVIIDLGGHTVTLNTASCSFLELPNISHDDAENPKTITVKNGNFNFTTTSTGTSIIRLAGKSGTHYVNCENLNIKSTATPYVAVSTAGTTKDGTSVVKATFTDCVFDYTSAQSACYMFASGNDGKIEATVKGCKILAGANNAISYITTSSTTKALAYYPATTNDTVKIEKNAKGEYLKLVLNSSASAPAQTNVYTTADGVECVFVKASDDGTNTTYTLYPKVMVGYKLQTSVTLYSNFVYNVYIPVANVKEFAVTFNDKSINEYKTEIIESVEYYCVSVELPAPETLNDIKVKVTLNSGSTTVDANWTLNVLKYAKSVLADTDTDDLTKASQTLVKDMLVYAKAAHTYFDKTADVADKLSEITTILTGYNPTVPTGTAKKPTDKTYFTDVAVYVGEVPSFRFYLAEGYTAADFTFTVGGNAVQVKEENGYVEIAMYAYRMLDDVTFTVNATGVSESYNLYSYYSFVTDPENTGSTAELVAIVEGLMKYSASAKAYRNAVIEA